MEMQTGVGGRKVDDTQKGGARRVRMDGAARVPVERRLSHCLFL
jgi:hypothetical protein